MTLRASVVGPAGSPLLANEVVPGRASDASALIAWGAR
jgi:hypothetical protein